MVTLVPSSSVMVRGNEGWVASGDGLGDSVAATVLEEAGIGEDVTGATDPPAAQAPATSATTSPTAETENPFRSDREGVGSGERSMVPALSREGGGHDRGPGDRTSSVGALVTVAGLCRIRTGFADPTILCSVVRRVYIR